MTHAGRWESAPGPVRRKTVRLAWRVELRLVYLVRALNISIVKCCLYGEYQLFRFLGYFFLKNAACTRSQIVALNLFVKVLAKNEQLG